MPKGIKTYYYYDHTYGEGFVLGDFGKLMNFIEESYDLDRHSIQDSLQAYKECCKENNNPIEKGV